MRKWPVAAVAGLVLALACSTAPEIAIVPTNRIVLAEFFTWARCEYCPYAARALDSVAHELGDSLAIVAYHRRVAGDTLSPECVETRRAYYYASGGEPATSFDGGGVVQTPGPDYNYETFRNSTLLAKNVPPKVQFELLGELDSTAGTVTVRVSGVDSTPSESLRLFIVLVEDSVRSYLPGAPDSLFNSVMRSMLPSVHGRSFRLLRGDTVEIEERFRPAAFWDQEMLGVVAFVQEPLSRRVLQAARLERILKGRQPW